jgi:hypothetical protein
MNAVDDSLGDADVLNKLGADAGVLVCGKLWSCISVKQSGVFGAGVNLVSTQYQDGQNCPITNPFPRFLPSLQLSFLHWVWIILTWC